MRAAEMIKLREEEENFKHLMNCPNITTTAREAAECCSQITDFGQQSECKEVSSNKQMAKQLADLKNETMEEAIARCKETHTGTRVDKCISRSEPSKKLRRAAEKAEEADVDVEMPKFEPISSEPPKCECAGVTNNYGTSENNPFYGRGEDCEDNALSWNGDYWCYVEPGSCGDLNTETVRVSTTMPDHQ